MGRRGLGGRVVSVVSGLGGLTLTDERYHFLEAVQTGHASQRSETRESQSQEEGDPVQLEVPCQLATGCREARKRLPGIQTC